MDYNNTVEVAEKLYYEANPTTKMDVPSYAYELVERYDRERIKVQSTLSLYDYIKMKWKDKGSQIFE